MTLRGNVQDFPLKSVVELLSQTKKTGELQVRLGDSVGALGIAGGRVVTAVFGEEEPLIALGSIFAIAGAEFEFTPWDDAPPANLDDGTLDELLGKAAEAKRQAEEARRKAEEEREAARKKAEAEAEAERQRIAELRTLIPTDDVPFRLSERAVDKGPVTLTAEEWRLVLAVNGERDLNAIAALLHLENIPALTALAELVRDGIIEAAPRQTPPVYEAPAPTAAAYEAPAPSAPAYEEPAPSAPAYETPAYDLSTPSTHAYAPEPARPSRSASVRGGDSDIRDAARTRGRRRPLPSPRLTSRRSPRPRRRLRRTGSRRTRRHPRRTGRPRRRPKPRRRSPRSSRAGPPSAMLLRRSRSGSSRKRWSRRPRWTTASAPSRASSVRRRPSPRRRLRRSRRPAPGHRPRPVPITGARRRSRSRRPTDGRSRRLRSQPPRKHPTIRGERRRRWLRRRARGRRLPPSRPRPKRTPGSLPQRRRHPAPGRHPPRAPSSADPWGAPGKADSRNASFRAAEPSAPPVEEWSPPPAAAPREEEARALWLRPREAGSASGRGHAARHRGRHR